MTDTDHDRFFTMAEAYDRMAPVLVPHYDWLQQEALRIPGLSARSAATVVDLGAGSGQLLEKVLKAYPQATCFWIDYSPDFLAVAEQRLAPYRDRVTFLQARMEEDWESRVGQQADVVFSMSAVHHLEDQEKVNLYGRCLRTLRSGGWLVNIDEVGTLFPDAYMNSLRFWVAHVEASQAVVPSENREHCRKWVSHFDRWRARNISNAGQPKVKGDDIHAPFEAQLRWLREVGFVNVDLFVKYHLWGIIGGQRPQ